MKLQVKLLAVVLALIVLPIIALGTTAYLELRRHTVSRLIDEARTVSRQAAAHIQSRIQAVEASTGLLARAFLVDRYLMTPDQSERYNLILPSLLDLFATYQQTYPEFLEIRLALPDGSIDARLVAFGVADPIDDGTITHVLRNTPGIEDGFQSRIVRDAGGHARLLCIQPIRLQDRTLSPLTAPQVLRGFMVTTVDLSFVDAVVASSPIGGTGHLEILDADGHSLSSRNNQPADWSADPGVMDRLRAIALSDETMTADLRGTVMVMGSEMPRPDLVVAWTVPEQELFVAIRRLAAFVTAVIVATIVVTCLLFYAVLRRLVLSPVAVLTGAVRDISQGRLLIDVPVRSRDEMGALARAFEDMGRALHDTQQQVRARTAELETARDRAEDANRAKSQFLATMSHEIRTPINGVLGMAELLAASDLTERQRHFLQSLRTSGATLLTVVNDILDISRIETGHLEIAHEPFDLRGLLSYLGDMVRPQAQEKGLTYASTIVDGVHGTFVGDADRLQQVLLNLVGNALKFTSVGSIAVRVRCEREDDHRAHLMFEVADTGIGVAAEDKERIFEAFMQVDGSYTRRYGGTGLGLAICRRLVALMGGEIGVESRPGTGSTFWFRVVLEKAAAERLATLVHPPRATNCGPLPVFRPPIEPPQQRQSGVAGQSRPATEGAKLLVADDDPISREIIELMLLGLGCDVETVSSGAEVLSTVERRRFDLILLDCSMPGMDGLETTRRLRQQERLAGVARTTVVAATANAFEDDRRRCLDAGMDDYMSKPFGSAELSMMIAKWRPPPAARPQFPAESALSGRADE